MRVPTRGAATLAAAGVAATALLLLLAACDQFSADGVAQTCLRSAMKHGEPYGSDGERRKNEEQLREYCRAAARAN